MSIISSKKPNNRGHVVRITADIVETTETGWVAVPHSFVVEDAEHKIVNKGSVPNNMIGYFSGVLETANEKANPITVPFGKYVSFFGKDEFEVV